MSASAPSSKPDAGNAQTDGELLNFEPKRPSESMLITTEDFGEFDTELGSGFTEDSKNGKPANLQTENHQQELVSIFLQFFKFSWLPFFRNTFSSIYFHFQR